eukprot:240799-Chlamydomonas_euryale.AAC.1
MVPEHGHLAALPDNDDDDDDGDDDGDGDDGDTGNSGCKVSPPPSQVSMHRAVGKQFLLRGPRMKVGIDCGEVSRKVSERKTERRQTRWPPSFCQAERQPYLV